MTSSLTSSWPSAASCSRTASTVMPAGWPAIDTTVTTVTTACVGRVAVCTAEMYARERMKKWRQCRERES